MKNNPIKAYRRANKISQKRLAEMLDVSTGLVSHIETGKRPITPEKAVEWEPLLNIPREQLCPEIFRKAA